MTETRLRFLVDHNVGRGVAASLLDAGYDARFVGDTDPYLGDAVILRWAVDEQRLVITQDTDFGALVYHSGQPHAGVLLLRMPSSTRDERVRAVLWIIAQHAEQLPGRFSVFDGSRLRIR